MSKETKILKLNALAGILSTAGTLFLGGIAFTNHNRAATLRADARHAKPAAVANALKTEAAYFDDKAKKDLWGLIGLGGTALGIGIQQGNSYLRRRHERQR